MSYRLLEAPRLNLAGYREDSCQALVVNNSGLAVLNYGMNNGRAQTPFVTLWSEGSEASLGACTGFALNDAGMVLVQTQTRSLALWANGQVQNLPGLGGVVDCLDWRYNPLNESGVVVGQGQFIRNRVDRGVRGLRWGLQGREMIGCVNSFV